MRFKMFKIGFATLLFGYFFMAVFSKALISTKKNIVESTALKCVEHDSSFARFDYCKLKPINRTTKALSLRVLLLKPPVTRSSIQFTMWKKANGYKPFIINVTLDVCQYFAGKKNPIFDWFYIIWLPYTNINHTCPYVSDMIVDQLPISNIKLPSLFPDGDYRLDLKVGAFDVWRVTVLVYLTIKEETFYGNT